MIKMSITPAEAKERLKNLSGKPIDAKKAEIYAGLTKVVDSKKSAVISFTSKGEHLAFLRATAPKKNPSPKKVIRKKSVKKKVSKKKTTSKSGYTANEKKAMAKMSPARKKSFKAMIKARKAKK